MRLEKDIEGALINAVRRRGGKCLKWVCPGQSGVPDRIVLMPGGKVAFCELKRPKGGKVSGLQKWWLDELTRLGFKAYLIKNEDDIKRFIKEMEE